MQSIPLPLSISIIAAMNYRGVIGNNNALPWHIPEDLKRFRALTLGHRIIMGRKTYDSIGKPLPGRENVVVSRTVTNIPGVIVVNSLASAYAMPDAPKQNVFMIGGAQLYSQTLEQFRSSVQFLYLTRVDADVLGDAHFPKIDFSQWECVNRMKGSTATLPTIDYEWQDWIARQP